MNTYQQQAEAIRKQEDEAQALYERRIEERREEMRLEEEREAEARRVQTERANSLSTILLENGSRDDSNKENLRILVYNMTVTGFCMNAIITAAVQSGKTKAMFYSISFLLFAGSNVVLSLDNKTGQMVQTLNRLTKYLASVNIGGVRPKVFIVQGARAVDLKRKIQRCHEENEKFILVSMDNVTQINKLYQVFEGFQGNLSILKDEADSSIKHYNMNEAVPGQAKSHKSWVALQNYFRDEGKNVPTFYVTATPDAVYKAVDVLARNVIELLPFVDYVGYDDIEYIEIIDGGNEQFQEVIAEKKAAGNNEVLLVAHDVKKIDQAESIERISRENGCTVASYNGDGFTTIFESQQQVDAYLLQIAGTKYTATGLKVIAKISVCKYLTHILDIGIKFTVIVGKNLLNRGISFASEHQENPLTATTLFIKGTGTVVELRQAGGRVTGNASPNLARKIYTDKDTIDRFRGANENNKRYMAAFKRPENFDRLCKDIVDETPVLKTPKVERPALKITQRRIDRRSPPVYTPSDLIEEDLSYNGDNGGNRMRELVNKWRADGDGTIIGGIFGFVLESDRGEQELRDFIARRSANVDYMSLNLIRRDNEYDLVFSRVNGITRIREEVLEYLRTR